MKPPQVTCTKPYSCESSTAHGCRWGPSWGKVARQSPRSGGILVPASESCSLGTCLHLQCKLTHLLKLSRYICLCPDRLEPTNQLTLLAQVRAEYPQSTLTSQHSLLTELRFPSNNCVVAPASDFLSHVSQCPFDSHRLSSRDDVQSFLMKMMVCADVKISHIFKTVMSRLQFSFLT